MSINRKGKCTGSDNPMFGKKRPDLSERNKVVNKLSVIKTSEKLRVKYNTPEYKEILRKSQNTRKEISIYKNGVFIERLGSIREMALKYCLDRKSINLVLSGKYSQHKDYTFSL